MVISVKEVNPSPAEGVELCHPEGCRRKAVIDSKYKGGIFCKFADNLIVLCMYMSDHLDDFQVGDRVLINIVRIDYDRCLIYDSVKRQI